MLDCQRPESHPVRDFDQDGNQSLGEDRLLTILAGNVDGAEGGDFGFTFA